jgi:hypothetical protein
MRSTLTALQTFPIVAAPKIFYLIGVELVKEIEDGLANSDKKPRKQDGFLDPASCGYS